MTRINRYVIENFVKMSATQNVEGEPVGALNRFYGKVIHPIGSRINGFFRTLKQRNKPLSVAFEYTLALGLVYFDLLLLGVAAPARARPAVRHRPHRRGGAVLHRPRRDRSSLLTDRYPVPLLVWARYTVQLVVILVWMLPRMGAGLFRTPRLRAAARPRR